MKFKLKFLSLVLPLVVGSAWNVLANPTGMTVVAGTASASTSGAQLNVNVSQATFLNWSSFNIKAGETTTFVQPSANSVVINQIGGANPSQIFGSLNANGTVILANANGFYFGPNSMVKVGGSFIATTATLPPDFGAGSAWQFTGMPPLASIVNYGQIEVGQGKSLYLIAEQIENHGRLNAPGGEVGLAAGQVVLLNDRADGRSFSAEVQMPSGSVDNFGRITADAGTIALQAKVVNQGGLIQANSIQNINGTIELIASDTVNLDANSAISAQGDTTGTSSGGAVTIKSGNNFSDQTGSTINISGGAQGGHGGQVEISAPNMNAIQSGINGASAAGFINGELTIDPLNISLAASGGNGTAGEYSSGTVNVSAPPVAGTLTLNINSFASSLSQISLQAANNITLATTWNLANSSGPANLNLTAGNNITFNNGAAINAGNNWTVNLVAGTGFVPTVAQPTPVSGSDGILLNGNSFIRTQNGDINLSAAGNVTVNSGYVNTVKGGNISATARFGDINAGNNNTGYLINGVKTLAGNPGLGLGANVGGISTLKGGNVSLNAGDDVISNLGTSPSGQMTPGASGAYAGGNVMVIAGNEISGNFLVSNGTGKLAAGVTVDSQNHVTINNPVADIGTAGTSVTLSLITGTWNAFAARNLYISEVNNPNGTFDSQYKEPVTGFAGNIDTGGNITAPPAKSIYLYNYAPDSGASFWAGNAIALGNGITRLSGQDVGTYAAAIYPPILSLTAGAGGIAVDTSIILYPSSHGALNIIDGGNLTGVVGVNTSTTGITMSDSGLPDYTTFGTGHAVTPLHVNDPNPVTLNISGSIANFDLTVPTFANINVGGTTPFTTPSGQNIFGTYNFNFSGQNLSSSATTRINVLGDIVYQGLVTSVNLGYYNATPLPAEVFDVANSTQPSVTQFLAYDTSTGLLSFRGAMTQDNLNFLQNPTVLVNGQPQAISLTPAQQAALAALYANSQGVYAAGSGIYLNGPGKLKITAQNMDLGTSSGIQVDPVNMTQLNTIPPHGAMLDIHLSGNLDMTSTAVANSGWLGGIKICVGGELNVGQQSLFGNASGVARGIYTTSAGDISVNAVRDVNVDGSRIAAFDGGNVTVISRQGNVNAGAGGLGDVEIGLELQLNANGTLVPVSTGRDISGSGIMALNDGASTIGVGNITIKALLGSINADVGGIEQIPFNHITSPDTFIELDAGKDIFAGNSGVIGSNLRFTAGGNISGLFVGSGAVSINAGKDFSGTIVGSTTVNVTAGGSVAGTIVGGENVSVSGGDITASLISGSVSASGNDSGASLGIPQSNVAKENTQFADNAMTTISKTGASDDDEFNKKKKGIALAQKASRVTVILPSKEKL